MKFLRRDQIKELSKFKSKKFFTTSFYFDTDKSNQQKKEIQLRLKNLINKSKKQIEQLTLAKEKKESLQNDLGKIKRYFRRNLDSLNCHGIALFSCSGENYWQELELPDPPRSRVVFDRNPYVRPLSAILDEHKRICALILDRKEAKIYSIFMNDISLLAQLTGNVPAKVREGGWEGYESKRIERHIETHLHDYFKACAQKTFDLFKENHFAWFFLGCKEEYLQDFVGHLHPYLKEKHKGNLKISPGDPPEKVIKESFKLEKELREQEEKELVECLVSELKKGGRAISGLRDTLQSLNLGEVHTLLITRHFSSEGRKCLQCGFLYVDEEICPGCRVKTQPLLDVVDEVVETAMDKSCQVKHINPPTLLSRYGNIGAFLRYQAQKQK
ncbi:MAG: hypothetical protein ACOC57_02280 [Acidobacteriota bacterium]